MYIFLHEFANQLFGLFRKMWYFIYMKEGRSTRVISLTVVFYVILMNSHIILGYLFSNTFSSDNSYCRPLRNKYRVVQHTISPASTSQSSLSAVKYKRCESDIDNLQKSFGTRIEVFLHLILQNGECSTISGHQSLLVDRAPPQTT